MRAFFPAWQDLARKSEAQGGAFRTDRRGDCASQYAPATLTLRRLRSPKV
jgi:hypothetical protein